MNAIISARTLLVLSVAASVSQAAMAEDAPVNSQLIYDISVAGEGGQSTNHRILSSDLGSVDCACLPNGGKVNIATAFSQDGKILTHLRIERDGQPVFEKNLVNRSGDTVGFPIADPNGLVMSIKPLRIVTNIEAYKAESTYKKPASRL